MRRAHAVAARERTVAFGDGTQEVPIGRHGIGSQLHARVTPLAGVAPRQSRVRGAQRSADLRGRGASCQLLDARRGHRVRPDVYAGGATVVREVIGPAVVAVA